MKQSLIREKTFTFAIKIIRLYKYLIIEKKEFIISKQLLRSGTSIGANVKESVNSVSRADFKNKMSTALKEADETEYWIELIIESEILKQDMVYEILNECREICKILNSIVKNT